MKHNSRKKKRGAGLRKKSNKKEMKSPFAISVIVLILFVVLIIFSIFKGPIKTDDSDLIIPEENIILQKGTDPTVNLNLAIASNDISKCNNDEFCKNAYYFAKADSLEDCEMLNGKLKESCRDDIYFRNAINNVDESYCSNIININSRNMCLEEAR